jgi:hypothetical protein
MHNVLSGGFITSTKKYIERKTDKSWSSASNSVTCSSQATCSSISLGHNLYIYTFKLCINIYLDLLCGLVITVPIY